MIYRMFTSNMKYTDTWLIIEIDQNQKIDEWLQKYFSEKLYVHDSDNCGSKQYEVVLSDLNYENKKFFEVTHSWWIDYDPEWQFHNTIEVYDIHAIALNYPEKERDWLVL